MNTKAAAVLSSILGTTLILCAWLATDTMKTMKSESVSVKGVAEKRVRADQAVWLGRLTVRAATLHEASARLQENAKKVMKFLDDEGFAKDLVTRSSISIEPVYAKRDGHRDETGAIASYRLEQRFSLSSKDVDKVTRLGEDSARLIAEGVELASSAPEYYISGLDTLKMELLAAASSDARARAERLVQGTGSKVGALRSAQQGNFDVSAPYKDSSNGYYSSYDTTTIDKVVRIVITVQYAIR